MRAVQHRRSTYHQGNKRVRGGTRHLKRLQATGNQPAPLPIEDLLKHQYYYEKLGLHPWHWHHQQPPNLVRKLAVQHLLTTFLAWQPALASLAEPVYSAVWLVGPEFAHSSQVVVGIGKRMKQYQSNFGTPDPTGPPLPIEYAQLPNANKLTWYTHPWKVWHDADDYPTGWPAYLRRLPHYEYQYPGSGLYLVVQTGWMWEGQLP